LLAKELEMVESAAKAWNDAFTLTVALHADVVDAVSRKYANVEDVRVVNRHCAKGALDCARMAQFVFKGTVVVPSKAQAERIKVRICFSIGCSLKKEKTKRLFMLSSERVAPAHQTF
jgi:hypothetical protein